MARNILLKPILQEYDLYKKRMVRILLIIWRILYVCIYVCLCMYVGLDICICMHVCQPTSTKFKHKLSIHINVCM